MIHFDNIFFHASLVLQIKIDADSAVNWACELLVQGIDTYHLRILAGLQPDKMMTQEETWEMVGKILDELNVPYLSKEKAAKIILTMILKGYLEQRISKGWLLGTLGLLCSANNYCDLFYPFYVLMNEEFYLFPNEENSQVEVHHQLDAWYLNELERIDKQVLFEIHKLLDFLEKEDESSVFQTLKAVNFSNIDFYDIGH